MSDEFKIRDVEEKDAARLVDIYSYYITDTAVSFEYEVPTVEEFADRIRKISAKYPYLVCERNGVILGYAYAGRYSPREAYNWTVTTSIYVDRECHRQGVGAALYDALEERLKAAGIVNLLAGIAFVEQEDEYLTHDSVKFHLKRGFEQVAHMKKIGKKFDTWYDLLWMQRRI